MGWIFCPFLQNPSPNSVTIGINLFLKERPGSVTILLEALEKSLSLSWPQGPPLRREMGHVCAASLLASVHGPNETFCIKIFRKKWKGLQLWSFLLVHWVPIQAHFCIFIQKKKNPPLLFFCRLRKGNDWRGTEQSHQLCGVDDLASSPALALSLPCLHPQLLTRSISGAGRKACGCGQEQSATELLSPCWSFHFLRPTPAGHWVLSFTLPFLD